MLRLYMGAHVRSLGRVVATEMNPCLRTQELCAKHPRGFPLEKAPPVPNTSKHIRASKNLRPQSHRATKLFKISGPFVLATTKSG
jgi:hypothetical protein